MEHDHTIPTHLQVRGKLTIGALSVTPKQALFVLLGGSLSYRLWHALAGLPLTGLAGGALHLLVACLPLLALCGLGWITLAGRSLDLWLILLLLYVSRPRQVLWRSVRAETVEAEDREQEQQ